MVRWCDGTYDYAQEAVGHARASDDGTDIGGPLLWGNSGRYKRGNAEAAATRSMHVVGLASSVNSSRCIETVRRLMQQLKPRTAMLRAKLASAGYAPAPVPQE